MRLGGTFDVDNKEKEIIEIENQLLDRGFNLGKNSYFPNVISIGNDSSSKFLFGQ